MPFVTVIEIDSEIVKIVHAHMGSKGLSVKKILACSVAGLPPEACASTIARLISKNGIKVDKLIGAMSRRDLTVRILRFPSTDKVELQQMVSLEAVKQIPFPAEEIFFDHRVMEINKEGYSQVILSIAHKNAVNKILEILSRSGLKPDTLTLTTEGLYLWAGTALTQQLETKNTLSIMNMDRNNVEIEIISGQRILLSRISSFGAISLSAETPEHDRYKQRLLLETKRSIDVYNKELKVKLPIEKLIITGSIEIAGSIADMFKNELGLDVSVVETTTAFPIADKAFSQEGLPEGVSVSSSLGAVFALDAHSLNMLPPELKMRQQLIRKGKRITTLIILGACLFFMMSAIAINKFYQKRTLLNNIKSSVGKIAPVTEELESKFKKIQMMKSHVKAAKRPLTFLYELHRVIPENVLLNYLSFDKRGRIILQGTTPAMSNVFNFVNRLEKSKNFKDVETRYISKRRLKDRETVDFQIICELSM